MSTNPGNSPQVTPPCHRHESPFTPTSNSRFLFESASYQAALKEIAYALSRCEPIIVVTGAIGTGKTTLCRIIAERRGPRTVVATISTPPDNVDDLLRQILDGFGVLTDDTSQIIQASHYGLLRTLAQFLASLVPLNVQAIIVFDEAQHLRPDILEQIRLLSNFDTDHRTLLQIILVGQPELDDLLSRNDLRQMDQRISRRHRLAPLQPAEVSVYVNRRLSVRHADQHIGEPPQFTASAMWAIARLSAGVPRVINTLSDAALEGAWADHTDTIDTMIVIRAARSLNIEVPFTVRVRAKRRHVRAALAAMGLLVGVLVGTVRDPAFFLWTRRTAAHSEAIYATSPVILGLKTIAQTNGSAPVAVADPPPETEAPPPGTAEASRFLIIVSSFRTGDHATRVAADILALGLPAFTRQTSVWQVVVGPYGSREDAVGAQTRLAAAHFADTQIAYSGTPLAPLPPIEPTPFGAEDGAVAEIQDLPLDGVLRRASALARQPNVTALLQIREQIVRRQAAASGATELGTFKSALDQIDHYLGEARRRQLEDDGRRLGVRPSAR